MHARSAATASSCGEACDDGNNVDGDGCSRDLQDRARLHVHAAGAGRQDDGAAVYRDFRCTCRPTSSPARPGSHDGRSPGMVQAMLDADGKPVYTGNVNSSHTTTATFAQWYRDTPGINHTTSRQARRSATTAMAAYVNRYGPNGEQWSVTTMAYFCGNVGARDAGPGDRHADPLHGRTYGTHRLRRVSTAMGYKLLHAPSTGGGLHAPSTRPRCSTGRRCSSPSTATPSRRPAERSQRDHPAALRRPELSRAETGMPKHNFSFTSEVRYWFKYDAHKTYTLDFTGDDDVWVFVNRKLAVDLGGIHTPVQGSVTLSAATRRTRTGCTDGSVYEVVVFQAERQTNGSSYQLTLSGFNAAPSECRPVCGDGIIGHRRGVRRRQERRRLRRLRPGLQAGRVLRRRRRPARRRGLRRRREHRQPCPSGCKKLIIPP